MDGELQPAAIASTNLVTLTEFQNEIRSTSPEHNMVAALIIAALLQGIPVAPQAAGSVSGC
jgi:hypothetical protein